MKKALLIIGLLYFSLSSCEEDSLVDNNPNPPVDNIELNFLTYYGGEPIKFDSLYTNNVGSKFIFDTVSMLVSDISFYDYNLEQTIDTARNYLKLSNYRSSGLTGILPAQGYYGNFQLVLGADSAQTVKDLPLLLQTDPEWIRGDAFGINFFKIKGRIFDPTTPPQDSIMIPIQYTLGSYMLADTSTSDVRGFSIDNLQQMKIFLLADLEPVLGNIPMEVVDRIKSDPTNTQDFSIAQAMADSLNIGIF